MPSLTLPDRLIWFAHCPKAGGTTVEKFMVSHWGEAVGHLHWGWDLWWKNGGWRVADPPNSPQHLIWPDAEAALPTSPDLVFAVVRDPVARMQSEHRWQRRLRRGGLLGRALAWLPFGLWLRLMLEMAARHPHTYDNHLRPQAAFVPEGATVFRLEDGLDAVLSWLAEETGGTPPSRQAARDNVTGLAPPPDAGALARIAYAFAEDYARFGYAPPEAPRPRRDWADRLATALAPVLVWLDRRGRL